MSPRPSPLHEKSLSLSVKVSNPSNRRGQQPADVHVGSADPARRGPDGRDIILEPAGEDDALAGAEHDVGAASMPVGVGADEQVATGIRGAGLHSRCQVSL